MRNRLPKRPTYKKFECGIINLDNDSGMGTHWVCYYRINKNCYYFDSFGNLQPPQEFIDCMNKKCTIYYNHKAQQTYTTVNCGHLCIKFLYEIYNKYIEKCVY